MPETVTGSLDCDEMQLCDEVEATIEGRRITLDYVDGEVWIGERHTLTVPDGRVIAFIPDRRRAYAADPGCDLETIEGIITSITSPSAGRDKATADVDGAVRPCPSPRRSG